MHTYVTSQIQSENKMTAGCTFTCSDIANLQQQSGMHNRTQHKDLLYCTFAMPYYTE